MDAIIKRIEALLNNEGRTEEEAAVYTAKAQELLEKHNLEMADLGKSKRGAHGDPRKDNKRKGGLYKWQRDLWENVSKLNFCHYLSIKGLERGSTYEHRIIGSHVNVLATEQMSQYLQSTIERIAQQWAKDRGINVFKREAIAYREGMADRLGERLRDMRRKREQEEARRQSEEAVRSKHPGAAPSAGALTIVQHSQNEDDLNHDYLCGLEPGTTTRLRLEREAKWAAEKAAREQWKRDNPEEAAAQEKAREEERERWWAEHLKREARNAKRRTGNVRYRKPTPEEERAQMYEFQQGRRRADDIGLDQQIDRENRKEVK